MEENKDKDAAKKVRMISKEIMELLWGFHGRLLPAERESVRTLLKVLGRMSLRLDREGEKARATLEESLAWIARIKEMVSTKAPQSSVEESR